MCERIATKAHLDRLTQEIEALVRQEKIPVGLGALTVSLIDGEVCDWKRFLHRKAVGSYTGCCPSEYSSGGVQRFGAIDRHGNKHVRVLLVDGARSAQGGFQKSITTSWARTKSAARIGAGDPPRRDNTMREAAPCESIQQG